MNKKLFFPMRFKESRPYMKALFADLQKISLTKQANPRLSMEFSSKAIFEALKKENIPISLEDPKFMWLFTLQNMEALTYIQWALSECQLYCFNNHLIEAFKHSSALDLSINNLHFPFEHSYFHFGTQKDLPLHNGTIFVEGAYVFYNKISLRIVLAGTWNDETRHQNPLHWFQRGKECYDLRIPSENYDKPLHQAIKNALHADIEDLLNAEKAIQANNSSIGGIQSSIDFIESHTANIESYTKALSLICNALCYLTAYPDDSQVGWQADSPQKLVTMAQSAKPKEKARATSKLKSMGFSIIHQIGSNFGKTIEKELTLTKINPEIGFRKTHWRRGHWRLQPYGQQHSLRKLIWITPVKVGGHHLEDVSRIREIE